MPLQAVGKNPIDAVKSIHMPFVTPVAQRYLHLSNTPNLDYSPSESIVTENPAGLLHILFTDLTLRLLF
jgi:hypothetical protein